MGISFVVAVVATVAFAATAAIALSNKPKPESGLEPQDLDSFGITKTEEGTAVPLLYGINRSPGNIIFYGNLETKEVFARAGSGKGGGEDRQLAGYEYRLDVIQTIGEGKLELLDTYVNDELTEPEVAQIFYNDGTTTVKPDFGQSTNNLEGIAFIGFHKIFLGENSTSLPTIHFVTKKILNTGLPNENMSHGNNAAAIVYDLFRKTGLEPSEINFSAFTDAANYCFTRDLALSIKINSVKEISQAINDIMKIIKGSVFIDGLNRASIRIFDPDESEDWIITDGDHKDLQVAVTTYSSLDNEFVAKYQDMDKDFSDRMVSDDNPALIEILGERKVATFDFGMIRKGSVASFLVHELMKELTYPARRLTFTSNLKLIDAVPGDVVKLTDSDLGIVDFFLRIDRITKPAISSNDISVEATEMVEKLFNTEFRPLNVSVGSGIGEIVPNLLIRDVFNFPYNEVTRFENFTIAITERTFGVETGFDVFFSPTRDIIPPAAEIEFQYKQTLTSFSLQGSLDSDYVFSSFIDEIGFNYTPDVTNYPEFDPIEIMRSLTQYDRFLLIDSEIMTFSEITPVGVGGSFKVTGIQRGVFGSRIKNTHTENSKIKIFHVLNNIINFEITNSSILQSQARFNNKLESSPYETINTNNDKHQLMATLPCVVEVTRTGVQLDVVTYPTNNESGGFGEGTPDDSVWEGDDRRELPEGGYYEVYFNDDNSTVTDFSTVNFTIDSPSGGQVILNIEVKIDKGSIVYESQASKMIIPSADGTYIFNFVSKWSRKKYNSSDVWLKDFIEPMEIL